MAATEAKLLLDRPLGELMDQNRELAAAWERGRRLLTLRRLALAGTPVAEIARHLGCEAEAFQGEVARDRELRDTLESARLRHLASLRAGVTAAAVKGNRAALEELLKGAETSVGPGVDPERLRVSQVSRFLGVSRVTLAKWWRQGATSVARNVDGTVSLPRLFAWRIDHQLDLLAAGTPGVGSGGTGSGSEEELRRERIRKLRTETDRKTGRLVEAEAVVVSQVAIAQGIVEVLDGQERLFPATLEGKGPREIEQAVREYNTDGRRRLLMMLAEKVPLQASVAARVAEFLRDLFPADAAALEECGSQEPVAGVDPPGDAASEVEDLERAFEDRDVQEGGDP